MPFTLYRPDKYPVFTGHSLQVGLATCWSDPAFVLQKYPNIYNHTGIIGSLYSKEGVSIILRNLCLNPSIRHLAIWGNSPLSNTQFGLAGREVITNIWKHGVEADNLVPGTNFRLHKEIDRTVLAKVIKNVTLHDISNTPLNQLEEVIISLTASSAQLPYMEPVNFPETERETNATFPSEEVGWVVRDPLLSQVWLKLVDRVLRYGSVKTTEYGNLQKELLGATWIIEGEDITHLSIPDWPEEVQHAIGIHPDMQKEYLTTFLDPLIPEGAAYTYGNRLRSYPGEIDQVTLFIEHLRASKLTRRAVATTMYPAQDTSHHSPPCLSFIQVLLSADGRINLFATFRSHDIFKAAIPNACALLNMQRYIASELDLPLGKVAITSNSAHIYEEDWKAASDLVQCGIIGRFSAQFNENTDIDPRGIVRIQVENRKIVARLLSYNGEELHEVIASTAREVILELAKLELLSRPDHYADISIEVAKAELAIKNDLVYIQDKPLKLGSGIIR